MSLQRFCESCEVSSTEATCWLCGGKTTTGQGPVSWNSSHEVRAEKQYTSVGGLVVEIPAEHVETIV